MENSLRRLEARVYCGWWHFTRCYFNFSSEGFLWKISRAGIFVAHNSTETKLYNTVESIEKISNERRDKAYILITVLQSSRRSFQE